MLPRIHLLHPELANQIAAGEVVDRPASIVKELLENSLDAQAKKIAIQIAEGGIKSIGVQDDGVGVHADDLMLAVSRHATSKISQTSHLSEIKTLGFRGEALASISSVSELTLTSRTLHQEKAWQVTARGREMTPVVQPAAHPLGTSVVVKNLFYNTPARKKFLRSSKTEWQAMMDVITRIALSRFDVAFTVFNEGKRVLECPAILQADYAAQRIATLLSQEFVSQAKAFDEQITAIRLQGWIAPAEFSRSSSDWQFFYVNGRMVKDKLIQHAIRQAYGEQLFSGRYPSYVMYLEIDPSEVDVNVHPTKHEVRFHHHRMVHDFIVKTIVEKLNADTQSQELPLAAYPQQRYDDTSFKPVTPVVYRDVDNIVNAVETQSMFGRVLTVLENKVIITETPSGALGVVNIHASLSCQLLQHLQKQASITQRPLLIPEVLDNEEMPIKADDLDILQKLGFSLELINHNHYVVREVPAFLEDHCVHDTMTVLQHSIMTKNKEKIDNKTQMLYSLLACASAPAIVGDALTKSIILSALSAAENLSKGTRCHHGMLAWKILEPNML